VPGHGVPTDGGHQFVEAEYMKEEELEQFLYDPSDYLIRTFMPRVFDAFAPLKRLPPLTGLIWGYGGIGGVPMLLSEPDFVEMFEAIGRYGKELKEWNKVMGTFVKDMEDIGFPPFSVSITMAPFDALPDFLRGMRGAMLDLYRQPERVIEATNKIQPLMINQGIGIAKMSGNPRVFIPLHRGAEGFMSLKQFEKFYWPGLKAVCLAMIDAGLTPWVFFEGDYASRLEYLLDLPKGKVLAHLDRTDIVKAKKMLGGHMAIMGNIPASLLQTGPKEEVVRYTRNLIDTIGKDGGYVMGCRSPMDRTEPELVKAWIDTTKEYGAYR
jgi:uroporphyrinogen-III decarboxylase